MTGQEPTEETIREEAKQLAANVRDARMELPDGSTGWIGYDMDFAETTKGTLILRGHEGLTTGQTGTALFFAAMYDVFGDESYRRDVREAVDFLLEEDVEDLTRDLNVGIDEGVGGLAYGLSVIAELTGESEYVDRAVALARTITDERIEADDEYDLLQGAAGEIAGLLRLYEQTGEDVALEKAVRCGEHLVANRLEELGYSVWDTFFTEMLEACTAGISHGAAGIALPLYRLYDHTGRTEFRDAADEAVAYENVFYSEYENNWKVNWSTIPQYPLWWAYGTPGIGLSRIGSLEYHDSETLQRDVERVKELDPGLTAKDSLLRGTFSQVDLLVELGRKYGDPYDERAAELALEAIQRKRRNGGYQIVCGGVDGITNPVLFYGQSGIGYVLLRVLEPERIPSVLRFE